jgi:hypothetical protein
VGLEDFLAQQAAGTAPAARRVVPPARQPRQAGSGHGEGSTAKAA